ncbi:hypothetical protein, partial [Geomonas propionica]
KVITQSAKVITQSAKVITQSAKVITQSAKVITKMVMTFAENFVHLTKGRLLPKVDVETVGRRG